MKLGFIGTGNMAGAILAGICQTKAVLPQDIYAFDIDGEKTNSLQFLHGIVPLGKVFRNGDIFHIQNDFFQMNIPNLRDYFDDTPIVEPILPVAKLKKYGNVSPPDIEIPIDRWGYADKVYNSMVDSVCPGQKATIYQKSHSFRRR